MKADAEAIANERARIEEVYKRREIEIDKDLYAPWEPATNLMAGERKRIAAKLLRKIERFPKRSDRCLEIGYGRLGWLADLLSWGLAESDLHGIELDRSRACFAQEAFPAADLRVGDATSVPWKDKSFDFVVASSVFSSIRDKDIREIVAGEIYRVLSVGGVLIWYDLAINNPNNPNVRAVNVKELRSLFPGLDISTRRVTLAPPVARFIAPKSFLMATILNSVPFLRTHLLGVLVKR